MENCNVLSLFDGISGAQIALNRAGIKYNKYFASEIDKNAIKVTQHNYPNTIQLGSVTDVKAENLPKIDILFGGFCCQSFSFAGKQLNFNDPRGKLFFEYVRLLKELKPKYFLAENVRMKKEYQDIISGYLGVEPILINSSKLSAQNRERNYWLGAIIERKVFNENYCNLECYESSKRRIQRESQAAGEAKILGEAQRRYGDLCDLSKNIFENGKEGDDKNLLGELLKSKQEDFRCKARQGEEESLQQNLSNRESRENFGISEIISENSQRKSSNEKSRQQTREEIKKAYENSSPEGNNEGEKEINSGGTDSNFENGAEMCCFFCGKRFNYRSYSTFIETRDKRIEEFTSSLSEMQFNEARQNNGRIFDIYQVQITQPEDKGIMLKDVIKENYDGIWVWPRGANKGGVKSYKGKSPSVTISSWQHNFLIYNGAAQRGRYAEDGKTEQVIEIRKDGKANALLTVQKNSLLAVKDKVRKFTPEEVEQLQTVPVGYSSCVSDNQRFKCLGNGWTIDVIVHILKNIV